MKYPGHYPSKPGKKPKNTNRGVRVYVNNFVEKAALVFQQLMSVVSSEQYAKSTLCRQRISYGYSHTRQKHF